MLLRTALLLAAAAATTTHAACPFSTTTTTTISARASSGCPFGVVGGGGPSTSAPSSSSSSTFLDAAATADLALAAAHYLADADVAFPPSITALLSKGATSRRALTQVPPDWRPALGDYVPHTALGAAKASLETILPDTQAAKWARYLGAWKASNFSMGAVHPGTGWAVRSDVDRLDSIKAEREADAASHRVDEKLAFAESVYASLIIPNIYGLLARLAFHDCGPYNPSLAAIAGSNSTGTSLPPGRAGGCNGSVRYEFAQSNSLDLFLAWPWVDAGHKALASKHPGVFSYADCIAIAASVAVAKASGPVMHVGYGRPDAAGSDPRSGVTHDPAGDRQLDGRAGVDRLLAAWAAFGHSATTLTTLVGAHAFGVSSQHAPIGLLTPQSIVFSNRYYERVRDGAGYFPSDDALRYSPVTAAIVEAYAEDEGAFFAAFTREFVAMTWWGVVAERQGVVG